MLSRIYWLGEFEQGKLGTMARPRGGDWLEDEIVNFKNRGIDTIVSLLEKSEIQELSLEKEADFCEKNGIEFINFPIPDFAIPQDASKTKELINHLKKQLNENKTLVIHCRMGIGRSSLIAASLLMTCFAYSAEEAFEEITIKRGLKVPDTQEQIEWVKKL